MTPGRRSRSTRLEAALRSLPESHAPTGRAPRKPRRAPGLSLADALASLTVDDLVAWPSVADPLPPAPALPARLSDHLESGDPSDE